MAIGQAGNVHQDQFVVAVPGSPGSSIGPAGNPATFAFRPIGGERDQLEGAIKYVTLNLLSSALFLIAVG
ncbi:MAG: hypothetical protein ACK418_27815, partial [Pseudomonas sp.]|uniref:hypothetical protein n=1 Tax=Pseudomonas sp. TaxID=306 RepID=UPI0039197F46